MHITTLFLWFMLYSVLGWIFETAYCSVKSLKWDNRGMLIGPYCPIYGVGAVLDVLLCSGLSSRWSVFFACMLGSVVLEYATSYATERIFHAVWWDYSNLPFNLHGRVCLSCTVSFGVAGIVVLYGLHPHASGLTGAIPLIWQEAAALALMAVFAADCAWTADSLIALNSKLELARKEIDLHISEKYDALIESTKQNLADGVSTIKERISLEEFRENKIWEELKKVKATMSWSQMRALRSSVSFRRASYSDLGNKMRHAFFRYRNKDVSASEIKERDAKKRDGA